MAKRAATTRRANGRRYSEAEKMIALQIIRSAGGSLTNEALANIRTVLKAPTLSFNSVVAWTKTRTTSEPAEVEIPSDATSGSTQVEVDFVKASTLEIVEHTFRQYAKRANHETAVEDTEGKDAARVMVDMAKLLQLLQGLPTDIVGVTAEFYAKARAQGRDAIAVMRALINEMDAEPVEVEQHV